VSDLINNPALIPPGTAVGAPTPAKPAAAQAPVTGPSFADVLAQQSAGGTTPTFSKHALDRLQRRGVDMNAQTLGRLTEGIQRAASKGANNSVVLVDGTAFVASVKNNTVITAVTPEAMKSHVFTNIDSAVIA
jgi:flagellar operon protein